MLTQVAYGCFCGTELGSSYRLSKTRVLQKRSSFFDLVLLCSQLQIVFTFVLSSLTDTDGSPDYTWVSTVSNQ